MTRFDVVCDTLAVGGVDDVMGAGARVKDDDDDDDDVNDTVHDYGFGIAVGQRKAHTYPSDDEDRDAKWWQ